MLTPSTHRWADASFQHMHKADFPVADRGTRILPATKANREEMRPFFDRPLIQYTAVEAGIQATIPTVALSRGVSFTLGRASA